MKLEQVLVKSKNLEHFRERPINRYLEQCGVNSHTYLTSDHVGEFLTVYLPQSKSCHVGS